MKHIPSRSQKPVEARKLTLRFQLLSPIDSGFVGSETPDGSSSCGSDSQVRSNANDFSDVRNEIPFHCFIFKGILVLTCGIKNH